MIQYWTKPWGMATLFEVGRSHCDTTKPPGQSANRSLDDVRRWELVEAVSLQSG
jgi:hypothetical protein